MKLYLEYTEYRSGGEVRAGMENDAWPEYEDEIIDFHPKEISLNRPADLWYIEELDIDFIADPGDTVWLVVPRYYDGCTFGRTCGFWKISAVCQTREEAEEVERVLRSDKNDDKKYRRPWFGYFAGLEDIEIHEMRLPGRPEQWFINLKGILKK